MSNCPSCGKPNCGNWSACARRKAAADEKAQRVATAWAVVVKTEVVIRRGMVEIGEHAEKANELSVEGLAKIRRAACGAIIEEVQRREQLQAFGRMFLGGWR